MIFHLHIPKTGGSSLITLLEREYGENYTRVPNWNQYTPSVWQEHWGNPLELVRQKCISGHYFFGFWEALNNVLPQEQKIQDPQFITFVRDPVDRLLSLYHYWRTNENRYQDYLLELTFEKFVFDDNPEWFFLDNDMTRRIAGIEGSDKTVDRSDYEQAIENLQYFSIIGVTDYFDETLKRWQELFGWKDLDYTFRLDQPDRLKKENLPEQTLREIREDQRYDYALYRHVLDKWWKS